MKRILLVLMALAAFAATADAQRLLPAQKGVEIEGGVPVQKHGMFSDGGYSLRLGGMKYMKHYHYYFFGADFFQQYYRYGEMKIPVRNYTADGGCMFHLLSTPGKGFGVYGGVYALLGYEEVNDGKHQLDDGARLEARDGFIYGGGVQLSLEGFVSDRFVLFVKARGHLLGGTDLDLFRPALNFGIRIIL